MPQETNVQEREHHILDVAEAVRDKIAEAPEELISIHGEYTYLRVAIDPESLRPDLDEALQDEIERLAEDEIIASPNIYSREQMSNLGVYLVIKDPDEFNLVNENDAIPQGMKVFDAMVVIGSISPAEDGKSIMHPLFVASLNPYQYLLPGDVSRVNTQDFAEWFSVIHPAREHRWEHSMQYDTHVSLSREVPMAELIEAADVIAMDFDLTRDEYVATTAGEHAISWVNFPR